MLGHGKIFGEGGQGYFCVLRTGAYFFLLKKWGGGGGHRFNVVLDVLISRIQIGKRDIDS